MSSPYENRGPSRRRGVWSHWVPLVLTVAVATAGVAVWALSQRKEGDHEENEVEAAAYQDLDYDNADYGDNPAYGVNRGGPGGPGAKPPSYPGGDARERGVGHSTAEGQKDQQGTGWGAQMSGALRRTPSPQQFLDSAKKTVAAGVTAAGAAVGSALAAIREEDKGAYADHETWSEEADAKKERSGPSQPKDASKRRKKVAIVVSADNHLDDTDSDGFHEHASILSHIPRNIDVTKIKLYILIYAPNLKDTPIAPSGNLPPPSLSSSFSNIDPAQAQTPGDEAKSPLVGATAADPAYNAIYAQAQALVEKDSMVLTFTTPNGHAHILRHIQPEIIYLQESLGGDNGSVVTQIQTWLRRDLILVVGAESGHGGLADSESEAEKPGKATELWWQKEERVGRGRGIVVVDGLRVHDDWLRRVQGKE